MPSIISLISSFKYSLLSSSIVSTLHTKTTRCGSDIVYISHSYVQVKNKCSRTHLLSIKTPQTQKVAFFFKLLRVALLDTTPSQNLKCTLYVHCYANMSKCILFYYYCKKYVKLCLDKQSCL
jgi:hypothetical protein